MKVKFLYDILNVQLDGRGKKMAKFSGVTFPVECQSIPVTVCLGSQHKQSLLESVTEKDYNTLGLRRYIFFFHDVQRNGSVTAY